jgi:flavin reductase (DIM6/NTAB) family NADH-FMN oxidoreductase RutF
MCRESFFDGRVYIAMNIRRAIKNIVFGDSLLPQEFTVGLADPQTEITVWLHGMGAPRDVTLRQSTACSSPFVICIAFDKGQAPSEEQLRHLSLKFCERVGQERVLGEIGLKLATTISAFSVGESELVFFGARSSANYCLPKIRLWAHYLFHAYSQLRAVNTSGMTMSFLERRAAVVSFIRPHPISLVSAVDADGGNIFTMNIMGDLGGGRFSFGLKDSRTGAQIVERTRRIALSTVPLPQARYVFALAANHFKQSIEFDQLPFETKKSSTFGIPVPVFAARVREMEVEEIHRVGSHTFFVAKIISDEIFADCEIVCAIHGFYQAWRLKGHSVELKASLAADSRNKEKILL